MAWAVCASLFAVAGTPEAARSIVPLVARAVCHSSSCTALAVVLRSVSVVVPAVVVVAVCHTLVVIVAAARPVASAESVAVVAVLVIAVVAVESVVAVTALVIAAGSVESVVSVVAVITWHVVTVVPVGRRIPEVSAIPTEVAAVESVSHAEAPSVVSHAVTVSERATVVP